MDISKLCINCFNEKIQGLKCANCGYTDGDLAKNQLHLPPGTVLKGQYLLGKVLGYGGFGVTYLAYDLNLQTIRAIKEYLPGELSTRSSDGLTIHSYSGEAAENYQYGLVKFVEEGRMLARYSDVHTIISVYDFFNENNTAYLVMEYLDGENLSEYATKKGGQLSIDETLKIIEPVFDALTAIHKTGMIHRDISPDNIFITKTGTTKLLDFGTARFAMGEKSKSLSVILKPGYAPLEQYYSRGKQGPWTDIYALAATIYRLVVGKSPTESMERQMEEDVEFLSNLDKYAPDYAKEALIKALSLKAEDRQQNIQEFQTELFKKRVIHNGFNDHLPTNKVAIDKLKKIPKQSLEPEQDQELKSNNQTNSESFPIRVGLLRKNPFKILLISSIIFLIAGLIISVVTPSEVVRTEWIYIYFCLIFIIDIGIKYDLHIKKIKRKLFLLAGIVLGIISCLFMANLNIEKVLFALVLLLNLFQIPKPKSKSSIKKSFILSTIQISLSIGLVLFSTEFEILFFGRIPVSLWYIWNLVLRSYTRGKPIKKTQWIFIVLDLCIIIGLLFLTRFFQRM